MTSKSLPRRKANRVRRKLPLARDEAARRPNNSLEVDRRHLLSGAVAALIAAMVRSPAARASMSEATQIITLTAIPAGEPVQPYPFVLFYDLSRYLTVRVDLDHALARDHFEYFRKEEWGWTNAAKLYQTLRRELEAGTGSAPELLMSGRLSKLDQWFAQHILDAWYEGFYRYDGQEIRITYDRAMMWDAVRDFVPVQGLSDGEYGYWAVPPKLRDK
jgi:hypothetical protein